MGIYKHNYRDRFIKHSTAANNRDLILMFFTPRLDMTSITQPQSKSYFAIQRGRAGGKPLNPSSHISKNFIIAPTGLILHGHNSVQSSDIFERLHNRYHILIRAILHSALVDPIERQSYTRKGERDFIMNSSWYISSVAMVYPRSQRIVHCVV